MTRAEMNDSAILIAAFSGWNDAGSAATTAARTLVDLWDLDLFESIDGEEFFDLQVNRPIVSRTESGQRIITFPSTDVYEGYSDSGQRVVVIIGIEPSVRWRGFIEELLARADTLAVERIFVLGALLADVPHTRQLPVAATSSSPSVRRELGIEESVYEGPTGIVGVFEHISAHEGFETCSLWTQVPHYVAELPCPMASLRLVQWLLAHLDESGDLTVLEGQADRWTEMVTALAAEDPEVAQYVTQLESTRDAADSPEATGDAIAAEFEKYLRGQGETP